MMEAAKLNTPATMHAVTRVFNLAALGIFI